MIRPDLPPDEAARLEALRSYAVLDTPPERAFDDLTELASRLCGTPISLVTLVDEGRQWFKSRTGLDAIETPREVAFCAHALCEPERVLVVPDARTDERFHDNPLVRTDPHVRFYAGVPLVEPGGHALGTLCVMDRVPRELDEVQLCALRVLGRQVVTQLELRKKLRELEEARGRAEAASTAKSAFLANMSHEVRTPMNAVLGMAELLQETPLSAEQAQYVSVFQSSGRALLELIDGILDLAKVEAGRLEVGCAAFDPCALVESVVEVLAVSACRKGLDLALDVEPDVPTTVRGDASRLRQVLVHLVGNAIKFTERGHVVLHVARGEGLRFAVRDTGIGFDPAAAERLFRPFTQLDAGSDRRRGGTGLGLCLSQRLVGLMGGEITARSAPGAGSTFAFELPLEVPDAAPPADPPSTAGRRVLVVDGAASERVALRHALERLGCRVAEAAGGPEALTLWGQARSRRRPFEVVLIDVRLPAPGGLAVVERLAADGGDLGRVVLLLPPDFRQGDLTRATEQGVGACLAKPVRRERLAEVLEAVLAGRPVPAPGARERALPEVRPDRPLRVLLVEDLPENRLLVRGYLADGGHAITEVADGESALRALRAGGHDVVLMDVHLPRMDGYAVTRAARAWEREQGRPRTPILALTADALETDRARSQAAGCDDHLTKPISRRTLLAALAHAVAAARPDAPELDDVAAPMPTAVDGRAPDRGAQPPLSPPTTESAEGPHAVDAVAAIRPAYLESRRSDLTALMAAADSGDLGTVRRIAHNIKGTGASFGFPELTRLGASLQAAAEAGDLPTARRDIDLLRSRLAELHDSEAPGGPS